MYFVHLFIDEIENEKGEEMKIKEEIKKTDPLLQQGTQKPSYTYNGKWSGGLILLCFNSNRLLKMKYNNTYKMCTTSIKKAPNR